MANANPWEVWGPPIVQAVVTVATAVFAYLGAKWLDERRQKDERFRKVYSKVLEDVILYLRYYSLWRDRSDSFDPSQVCDRILDHVKGHLGDFGHRVVTSYLAFTAEQVQYSGRGGTPNPVPIFWHIVEEAYDLIKDLKQYGNEFKKQLETYRTDYFIWAMIGDELFRWRWALPIRDLSLSYDDLVQEYGSNVLKWRDAPPSDCFIRDVIPRRDQAEQVLAYIQGKVDSPVLFD